MAYVGCLFSKILGFFSFFLRGINKGTRGLADVLGISGSKEIARSRGVRSKDLKGATTSSVKESKATHTVSVAADVEEEIPGEVEHVQGTKSPRHILKDAKDGTMAALDDGTEQQERLPSSIVPFHYEIELTPGIQSDGGHKFEGLVHIYVSVAQSTSVICMNSDSLQIKKIDVTPQSDKIKGVEVKEWKINEETAQLSVILSEKLPVDTKWKIGIEYTGKHRDAMDGFYRVAVHDGSVKKYMFSTQFESRSCCKAIPCWDEPVYKSTFSVKLIVSNGVVALSNMDVVSDTPLKSPQSDMRVVEYRVTPKMSTYLLAFVVGELNFVESYTNPITLPGGSKTDAVRCRVYSTPNRVGMSSFALDVGSKALEFYQKYFDYPYPLDKLDQVAIADFSAGAMENWGLVTYREAALLFDPLKSSSRFKLRIATTVAHELAHQWFGNLVTMKWWNDLWLNEGFATFASAIALNELYPEWEPFVEFVNDDLASALELDGLATTHPIDVPINKTSDIDQVFDSICYSKGASIMNMVHSYLGNDMFRESLRHYIKKYKYSNTVSDDIWKSFDEITKLDLSHNMHNWIKKPGYPLVMVVDQSYDEHANTVTLTLRQKRYFSSGIPTKEDADTIWWIPVVVVTGNGDKKEYFKYEFNTREMKISFLYKNTKNSFWKINSNCGGFYRVCIKAEHANAICSVLKNNGSSISVQDKLGILSDSYAVAKSGEGDFETVLNLIKSLEGEKNFFVVSLISRILSSLSHVMYLRPKSTTDAINRFIRYMFSGMVDEIGYKPKQGESTPESLKRSVLMSILVNAEDQKVISELKRRFKLYINGDEDALHSDVKDAAYCAVLKYSEAPEEDLKIMLGLYEGAKTPDQSIVSLASLGAVNSNSLIHDLVHNYSVNSELVRPQDVIYLYRSISHKNQDIKYSNKVLWEFVTNNWDHFCKQFSSSVSLLGSIFTSPIDSQIGQDVLETVTDWINGKDLKGPDAEAALLRRTKYLNLIKRDVDQSMEALEIRTKWVNRAYGEVEGWLKKEGFFKD